MSDALSEDGSDINQDDSQEDVMTPAELIAKLEEAWLNEKFSPELLENKSEVVECVMEQLTHMVSTRGIPVSCVYSFNGRREMTAYKQ
ncbi:DNA replication complex GINS protein SLD5 [Goodea atripinnis]|uniref:DNA replication complex GINS protein SLD5 n=1 Tax=Goodea atripinnis TaxID=208336 RepID=A0ABV0NZW6_9TELE